MNWIALVLMLGGPVAQGRVPLSDAGGSLWQRTDSHAWAMRYRRLALPGTVTDLRVLAVSDTSVALSWTEVNSGTSTVARYQVRVAIPSDHVAFDTGLDACGSPVYGSTVGGGKLRSCVVMNLAPNTQYAFQLVAFTGNFTTTTNMGAKSNTVLTTTARRWGPVLIVHPSGGAGQAFSFRRVVTTYLYAPPDTWAFPLQGTFGTGDYYSIALDDSNRVVAKAYLYVIKVP